MQFWKLAIIQQYIFLMLLLLLSLVPDLAIAAPKTTLPQIRIALKKDDQLTNVNWTYQVSALWEKNSKGETEFFWAVKVDFPQSQSILRASVSTDPTGEVFQVKKIDTRRGRPASTPRVYFDPTGGITFKTSALNQTFTLETK